VPGTDERKMNRALALLAITTARDRIERPLLAWAIFLGSSTLATATVFLDPGGYFSWFLD